MKITKELAHVVHGENQLVHEVAQTGPNRFECEFSVDGTHPYLYENPAIANHVSGTTFLDMTRQLLKAISHLFYAAPLGNRFVIRGVRMDFTRWAKLEVPIQAVVELNPTAKAIRGLHYTTFAARVTLYQEGWQIAAMSGEFSTMPLALEERFMSRQYRQPPRGAHAKAS